MHGNHRRYRVHSAGVTFECIAPRGSYCIGILKSLYNNATIEPVFDEQDDGVVHPTGGSIATEDDSQRTEEYDDDDDYSWGDDKENQGNCNGVDETKSRNGTVTGEGGGDTDDESFADDFDEESMQESETVGEDRGWERLKVDLPEGTRKDTSGSSFSYASVRHTGSVPDNLREFIQKLGDSDFRRRHRIDRARDGDSGGSSRRETKGEKEEDEREGGVTWGVSDLYTSEDDKQKKKD